MPLRSVGHLAVAGTVLVALAIAPRAEPSFSGANGEIAYSIVLPNSHQGVFGDSRDIDIDICTIRPGSGVRRRITGPGSNSLWSNGAAWSADGSRLAFMAIGSFAPAVVVAQADASESTILIPQGRSPAWAPSGDRIVYVSAEGRLAVVNVVDGQQRVLAERGDQPAWSPDGSRIAYVVNGQLAVVGADGSASVVLTSGAEIIVSPNWSPDGQRLVFASQAGQDAQPKIEVMNSDGSGRTRLISVRRTSAFGSPGFVDPTWSPDGSKIAFVQRQEDSDATDVYTINTDGSNPVNLTRSPFYESSIDWRPLAASGFVSPSKASCGIGGTSGADTLGGTPTDDVVYALAGSDRVSVGGGFDIVLAGEGKDRVRMGSGEDDLAFGGAGNDLLDGGDGSDGLFGGPGVDHLFGGGGPDELQGEPGNDVLAGGPGADVLVGGPGNDQITAGPGRDVDVRGGDGNDRIFLRDRERDIVHCGRGRDEVHADRSDRVFGDCERVLRR